MSGGTKEKVEDVWSAGSIGAAFVVVLTLTLPDGIIVVFVLMRITFPAFVCSIKEFTLGSGVLSCYPGPDA